MALQMADVCVRLILSFMLSIYLKLRLYLLFTWLRLEIQQALNPHVIILGLPNI